MSVQPWEPVRVWNSRAFHHERSPLSLMRWTRFWSAVLAGPTTVELANGQKIIVRAKR